MRGQQPTLPDVVLHELPEPVSLFCEEQLEEEEEQGAQYTVYTVCGRCRHRLKLNICASAESRRAFESLLLGDLQILCLPCGD
ncbi:E7 protein [Rupicapra rupicapra papillomavirus 1]|uniref:Protein E7 n=1 Tax=Rupicapra rupicapra papillomavirus 1 TaxID=1163708 RepID=X2DEW6_9PAPI|nr:E7 protein [Rupicapra rupicapra papillomavirus 1]AHL46425.1 E7 protein [Rupicapra rupicapra papillomavirus 1]